MADKETDPTEVYLKEVRLSYPHLFEKHKANADAKPKYGAVFLIDPTTKAGKANIKKIEAAIKAAEQAEFGKTGLRYKEDRLCYRNGDDELDSAGEVKKGYEGMKVVRASNDNPITLLTRKKANVEQAKSPFYAGCYVECVVRFYGTKKGAAPGVFATVEAIRFWEDGERIGGSGRVGADAFDDDDDDDNDDDTDFSVDDDD